MKNLIFKLTLLLSTLMFPSISLAEWDKVAVSNINDVYYIDHKTVKILGTTRLFYQLTDYVRPTKYGDLSSKIYVELNCQNLYYKYLVAFFYPEPLGKGNPVEGSGPVENPSWNPTVDKSVAEKVHKYVCKLKY